MRYDHEIGTLMLLRELLTPDVARRDCDGKWVLDYDRFLAAITERIANGVAYLAKQDDATTDN